MNGLQRFALGAAAGTLVGLLPVLAQANGLWHSNGRRDFQPQGTWINTVWVWPRASADADCGAPPANAGRFESLTTFFATGELIEGAGPAAGPPTVAAAVSRSAGHGLWERIGRRSILQTFRQHYLNAAGVTSRTNVVQNIAELKQGDDPATADVVEPYYLLGRGTNLITNVLIPPGSGLAPRVYGCNQSSSRPYALEE
jgi:hypothetical protein